MDQILGWIATVMFTVCYVPQVAKTFRSRTLDGLSISLFVIQLAANVVALVYATLIDQPALIVKYALAIVMLAIVLASIYLVMER